MKEVDMEPGIHVNKKGCEIGLVEYKENLSIRGRSSVKEKEKDTMMGLLSVYATSKKDWDSR